MARPHHVLIALGVLVFLGWAAHFAYGGYAPSAVECAPKRVATFGWTHRDRPLAELAAIMRWKEISRRRGLGFAEWHNARGRYLTCRTVGGPNGHYQCRIAATPCRRAAETDPG